MIEKLDKNIKELISLLRGKFERDVISVNIISILFALRLEHILREEIPNVSDQGIHIDDYDSLIRFIKHVDENLQEPYEHLFSQLLDDDIGKLVPENLAIQILDKLMEQDYSISNIGVDRFGYIFTRLLKTHPLNNKGNGEDRSSEYVTEDFSEFIQDYQKDEIDFLDPAFGLGISAIQIVKQNPRKFINVHGYEINERTYDFARMNLISNGIYRFQLGHQNSLVSNWETNYDVIISEPPFSAKNDAPFGETGDVGCDIILKSLSHLKPEGKALFLMPATILTGKGKFSVFRENLVDSNVITSVTKLPPRTGATYSNVDSCLILLQTGKLTNDILMVDNMTAFKEAVEKSEVSENYALVSKNEIIKANYNLEPKRYISPVFKKIDSLKKQKRAIRLKQILKPIRNLGRDEHYDICGYITQEELKNEPFDFELSYGSDFHSGNVEYDPNDYSFNNTDLRKTRNYYLVNESTLLISRIGKNLKPTILNLGQEAVWVKNSIHTYTFLSDKIRYDYLILQLHSDLVKEQLEVYRTGSAIKYISTTDFLDIYIETPPVDSDDFVLKQEQYIEERRENVFKELYQEKKREFEELSKSKEAEGLKDVEEEGIIDYVNHNVRNQLSGVKDSVELLYEYLKDNEGAEIYLDALDGEPLKGETEKDLSTIRDYFQQSMIGLDKALMSLQTLEDFRIESFKEEDFREINLYEFLTHYCQQNNVSKAYSLEVISKEETEDVFITSIFDNPFENVLNNLLANAEKHGFKGDKSKYRIRFSLSIEDDWIVIDYFNDGEPIEVPFKDYISQGKSGGMNAGTGFGGFFINKTIEKLYGKFLEGKFLENEKHGWNVNFRIKLPLTITH